jgi:ketosteroid isomerase-like protein
MTGQVTREVLDFRVQVDESIAFGHALVRMRVTGTDAAPIDGLWHVSTGYRNVGLRWLTAYEHVSVVDTKERS